MKKSDGAPATDADVAVITNRDTGYWWILHRGSEAVEFQTPDMVAEQVAAAGLEVYLSVEEAETVADAAETAERLDKRKADVARQAPGRSACWPTMFGKLIAASITMPTIAVACAADPRAVSKETSPYARQCACSYDDNFVGAIDWRPTGTWQARRGHGPMTTRDTPTLTIDQWPSGE